MALVRSSEEDVYYRNDSMKLLMMSISVLSYLMAVDGVWGGGWPLTKVDEEKREHKRWRSEVLCARQDAKMVRAVSPVFLRTTD